MSGPAGSHRGRSAPAPTRGPAAEPRRRRGRETGEGRKTKARGNGKERAPWIKMATYNIRDGRQEGLQSATRALGRTGADIAFLQEVKIKDPKFATKRFDGYEIRTAAAGTARCGGVALLVRENNEWAFTVENEKVVGPNVISFELVTGRHKRWFVVGCYLPPSDKEGATQRMVIDALENRPKGTCPMLIGDLNANLDFPRDRQEEILSSAMAEMTLTCATKGYRIRKKRRRTHGRWTFQRHEDRGGGGRTWIRSKPDYFLIREQDRRKVKSCRWILPPHHNSDHRALIVKIGGEPGGGEGIC